MSLLAGGDCNVHKGSQEAKLSRRESTNSMGSYFALAGLDGGRDFCTLWGDSENVQLKRTLRYSYVYLYTFARSIATSAVLCLLGCALRVRINFNLHMLPPQMDMEISTRRLVFLKKKTRFT